MGGASGESGAPVRRRAGRVSVPVSGSAATPPLRAGAGSAWALPWTPCLVPDPTAAVSLSTGLECLN